MSLARDQLSVRCLVAFAIVVAACSSPRRDASDSPATTSPSVAVPSPSVPAPPRHSVPSTAVFVPAITPGGTGKAFDAPATIAADCSVDVADALNTWLASVPDGATIQLEEDGCYRIETPVRLVGRHGIVIEGNHATLRAFTDGTGARLTVRGRSHLAIVGSSDVIVRNLVVRGANRNAGTGTAAYRPELEGQHAFVLNGDERMRLDGVEASDVYGDFVYIGAGAGRPSRDITVTNSHFARSGRQGISITDAIDVSVTGNDLRDVARSLFDLEPNLRSAEVRHVRIAENRTGSVRNFWLANKGSGINITDIVIEDNDAYAASGGLVFVYGPKWGKRGPFRFVDNNFRFTGAVTDEDARGAFLLANAHGVDITGNEIRTSAGPVPLVELRNSDRVRVDGNRCVGLTRCE